MPIFQYDPYRNAYGPSIAEALAHQNDAPAQAALRIGDLQAQGAERTAALQGQLWTSLGNIPAQIQASNEAAQKLALQKQAGQLQAQQLQEGALTLSDAQAQHDADRQLSTIFANTPRNADGTYDTRAFINNVPADLTKYAGKWVQQANAITDTWLADDARRKGTVQASALALLQAGAPFQATQGLIDSAHRDRVLTDDQATQYKTQLVEDPKGASTVLRILGGYQKPITKKDDESLLDPATLGTLVPSTPKANWDPVKDLQGPNGEPLFLNKDTRQLVTAAGVNVMNPTAVKKDETPKAGTPEDWVARARRLAVAQNGGAPLTDAQLQTVDAAALQGFKTANVDPEMRDAALAQKNIAASLAQLQLNQTPTAAQAASVADDLVNHRIAPEQLASLFSTRGREGLAFKLAVSAEAKKLDPAFNWEESAANYQLVKSPAFQNTVRYMDSVQESLPRFLQNVNTLGRGQFKSLNEIANAVGTQFNDTDLKRVKVDASLVGDEVAKIMSGGGTGSATSDAKLKQATDLISAADSVPAVAAGLDEINALLGNRRQSLTRGTYLEGTQARPAASAPAAPAPPAKGALRTNPANGARAVWDGAKWQPVP